ncbi:unnamed protein product [Ectocarpus sp. 12 AP-2014]
MQSLYCCIVCCTHQQCQVSPLLCIYSLQNQDKKNLTYYTKSPTPMYHIFDETLNRPIVVIGAFFVTNAFRPDFSIFVVGIFASKCPTSFFLLCPEVCPIQFTCTTKNPFPHNRTPLNPPLPFLPHPVPLFPPLYMYPQPANKPDPEARLYKIAARNLREYNGVPSMTPPKLIKTLAFLKLNPQRLVKQGLAPKNLLARMKAEAANNAKVSKVPLGDGKNNEDLAESVAAGMELMSVEDDKKEWNDGFVSVKPAETPSPDIDNEEENNDAVPEVKKNLIHKAFIAGGIQLRPREVRPLLVALDVRPWRLAKLGLVDGKDLRAMLQAERKAAYKRHGHDNNDDTAALHLRRHHHRDYHRQQHRLAGRPHPFTPPPPPPPAHQEVRDAMFAARGGGGGRRCASHRHGAPHRHGPPHLHGGAPHHHGPPPPMKRVMRGGRPHPFAPPPPPAHMEDDHEAPGGGGGGRRGGPHFHPAHQHYAEVFEEDEGGHPGFHPHHGPPRWMAIRRAHGGGGYGRGYGGVFGGGVGQRQRRDHYWG